MTSNAKFEKDLFKEMEELYLEMEHERAEIIGNLAYVQGALDYYNRTAVVCNEEYAKLQQYLTDAIDFVRTVRF